MFKLDEYIPCPQLEGKIIDLNKAQKNGWSYEITESKIGYVALLQKQINNFFVAVVVCWEERCQGEIDGISIDARKGQIIFVAIVNLQGNLYTCDDVPELVKRIENEIVKIEKTSLLPLIILGSALVIGAVVVMKK